MRDVLPLPERVNRIGYNLLRVESVSALERVALELVGTVKGVRMVFPVAVDMHNGEITLRAEPYKLASAAQSQPERDPEPRQIQIVPLNRLRRKPSAWSTRDGLRLNNSSRDKGGAVRAPNSRTACTAPSNHEESDVTIEPVRRRWSWHFASSAC